jgi:hypothetical protein
MPANPMMAQPIRRPEQEEEPEPLPAPPAQPLPTPEPPVTKEAAPVPAAKTKPRPQQADIESIPSLDAQPPASSAPTAGSKAKTAPQASSKPAKPPLVQDPLPVATPAPKAVLPPSASNESTAAAENIDFPRTVRETLQRIDQSWAAFRAAALRIPLRGLDERIGVDGWTRKQMLAHVAAWHDLTADRIVKLVNFGELEPLDRDTDHFNAAVARQAVGKTSGEVLKDLDATFNRMRRQVARMTDAQLESNDWFAAWVIGGNTYGHYAEHWADVTPSESARR